MQILMNVLLMILFVINFATTLREVTSVLAVEVTSSQLYRTDVKVDLYTYMHYVSIVCNNNNVLCKSDINECTEVNDCQQICENTLGSYDCRCMQGFTLENDGRNCTGKI